VLELFPKTSVVFFGGFFLRVVDHPLNESLAPNKQRPHDETINTNTSYKWLFISMSSYCIITYQSLSWRQIYIYITPV